HSLDWLQLFEQSITSLDSNEHLKAEPERWKLHRDSYQSQVDELKSEIIEYERLINCDTSNPLKSSLKRAIAIRENRTQIGNTE
ncbi:MAG: hypothetical protein ACYTX0_37445, partial [Nostoc sp.]